MNWSRSAGLLLLASIGFLQGCEELTNKEKDPLVPVLPSRFYGYGTGFELQSRETLSRYFLATASRSAKFGYYDLLSDEFEGSPPGYSDGEYRQDRDFRWLTERRSSRFVRGSFDVEGEYWFTMNTNQESLNFIVRGSDPDDLDIDFFPIDNADGNYNCLRYDAFPTPAMQTFSLDLQGGQGILTNTSAEIIEPREQTPQVVRMSPGTFAKMDVEGERAKEFTNICAGKEPAGFQDDFYDYLISEFSSQSAYYDICWTSRAVGGYQYEGKLLHYSHVGIVSVQLKPDVVNSDTVYPLPPDIAAMIDPDSNNVQGINAYRPSRTNMVCLAEAENAQTADLEGSFWVGQSLIGQGDPYVAFSQMYFDGDGEFLDEQVDISADLNLKSSSGSYFVERNGELFFNGRQGLFSNDRKLVVLDMSDPADNVVGFAVGIMVPEEQPALEEEEAEE